MKIRIIRPCGQLYMAGLLLIVLSACTGRKDDIPVMPPPTLPLTQGQIGFGVVNVSYTRVNSQPNENSALSGHLRRGSVVRIMERRLIQSGRIPESWVLVEANFQGWLRETLVDIYHNEQQAKTASREALIYSRE